jgi:sulfur transfer protein SufE
MRMSFAGRGNENDRYRMVVEYGNRLCARRESERQNTEWGRTGNDRILLQP